jgi:hypothetical protein
VTRVPADSTKTLVIQFYKSLKMSVFWAVALCSLVEVYQCFRGACCLHHQVFDHTDDGGSKLL